MNIEIRICQKQDEKSHQGKIIFSETDFVNFTIGSVELQTLIGNNKLKFKRQNEESKTIYNVTLILKEND